MTSAFAFRSVLYKSPRGIGVTAIPPRQGQHGAASVLLQQRRPTDRRCRLFKTRCFSSTASTTPEDFVQNSQKALTVTYITDIEGDMAYLNRYVEISKVLAFIDNTNKNGKNLPYSKCIDFTDPQAMLVFGGDVWDKGGHDLYVVRQLVDLKRRYPDRVVFILGNRDVNKLRILQEIGLQEPAPPHPGLLWFKGTGNIGDPDGNLPSMDSVERLQWILAGTMGSPNAFALRKQELEWERRNEPEKEVTDLDVVESYRASCHPKGELGQFISQAQFVSKLGTLLFVHGSLPLLSDYVAQKHQEGVSVWDDLTFCMPWLPKGQTAETSGVSTIDDWISAVNSFGQQRVDEWKDYIARVEANGGVDDSADAVWAYRAGYHYGPSYSDLVQYGMGRIPGGAKNPTVVYNSFTPDGMPNRFYPDSEEPHMVTATKEFFERAGVQAILAGHKPQGDMPSPIRIDESAWILLADTSYSGDTIWHEGESKGRTNLGRGDALSFRGDVAVSEILITMKEQGIQNIQYHGVLSDGSEYETANLLDNTWNTTIGQAAPEELVPAELDSPHQGRWWTKSIFSDGSHLFHAGEGYNVWNFVSAAKPAGKSE